MKLKDLTNSIAFQWNNRAKDLQKELVIEKKTFGIPNGIECVYYDHYKDLIFIGTSKAEIYVGGGPSIQITAKHAIHCSVQQIMAVDEATRKYITVTQSEKGSSIHSWELTNDNGFTELEEISYVAINLKIGKVTETCLSNDRKTLYIGTYSGHICQLTLLTLTLEHDVIFHENVRKRTQSSSSLGSVKCLSTKGLSDKMILVGYSGGTIVLLDIVSTLPLCTFKHTVGLESLFMDYIKGSFIASYSDGTISYWDLNTTRMVDLNTRSSIKNRVLTNYQPSQKFRPFGDSRCHPLKCVHWYDPFFLFVSGTPIIRREHDYTMTVMSGGKIVLQVEFGSRVIEMIPIFDDLASDDSNENYVPYSVSEYAVNNYPKFMCILTEEEIIIINCQLIFAEIVLKKVTETITSCKMEHFPCIHASSVSAVAVYMNISDESFERMNKIQRMINLSSFQQNEWPINGGSSMRNLCGKNGFIITGHEDGSVNFWYTNDVTEFSHFFRLQTHFMYEEYTPIYRRRMSEIDNQKFPIFKCGYYDSFQEDIRFCIQALIFEPDSSTLIVGGNAGNIMVFSFEAGKTDEVKQAKFDFTTTRNDIEWKGHSSLIFDKKSRETHFFLSFLSHHLSIFPPTPIIALDYSREWGLITASSCHGYVIYDCICNLKVTTKCTCDAVCLKEGGSLLRRTTVFKSLRSSFRRLSARFSSKRKTNDSSCNAASTSKNSQRPLAYRNSLRIRKKMTESELNNLSHATSKSRFTKEHIAGVCVSVPDSPSTRRPLINTLKFAALSTKDNVPADPILVAGCNSGWMYILSFIIPCFQDRYKIPVTLLLEKHVKSKHMAPVIDACQFKTESVFSMTDDQPHPKHADKLKHLSMSNVLVATEEQIKIFEFPSLKSRGKIKVTAMTGSKIRKVQIFKNILNKSPYENERGVSGIAILTNSGQLLIFSLATFRLCIQIDLIEAENLMGISISGFSENCCGFFMQSNSQITYFTLSESPIFLNSCVISSDLREKYQKQTRKISGDLSSCIKGDETTENLSN